jgi:hypothetical protein
LGGATLAQLVEQLIRNQQVVGSNPTGGSMRNPLLSKTFVFLGGWAGGSPSREVNHMVCKKYKLQTPEG